MPENEEALWFYLEVRTQWRVSIGGLVGLDYGAVKNEAERLEVDLSNSLMAKIKAIERAEIGRGNENKRKNARSGPPAKTA